MARLRIQSINILLVLLFLASCATQRPSPTEVNVKEPAVVQMIMVPEGLEARRSLFSKLVLNLPRGATFGAVRGGAFCVTNRDLKWEQGPLVMNEEDIRTAFNEVFQKGNYPVAGKVDALFEDLSEADLIVAGLVKELQADICNRVTMGILVPTKIESQTDLSLKVNWQVFSRTEGKVVYEIPIEGKYTGSGNLRACIIGAFANATEKLLAERAFYDLVVGPKKGKDKLAQISQAQMHFR